MRKIYKGYVYFFCMGIFIYIIYGCSGRNHTEKEQLNDLIVICDSLELAGDSTLLEETACLLSEYPPEEENRLRSSLYKISAAYNQGKYYYVLNALNRFSSDSAWIGFPEGEARALFLEARALQKMKLYGQAIRVYEKLISLTPDENGGKRITCIMKEGLLQMMYCYIFAGKREAGVRAFCDIDCNKNFWLRNRYPRSIKVCLAYSLYEASHLAEAASVITQALSIDEKDRENEQLYVDYGIAAVIYNQFGDIRKAISCSEQCLSILNRLNEKNGIFYALSNLIYQYQQIGEFEKSLATYEKLLQTDEIKKNPYNYCVAEVNISSLFREWGLDEECMGHLDVARRMAYLSKETDALLRVNNMELLILMDKSDYNSAFGVLDSISSLLPVNDRGSFYQLYYDVYRSLLKIDSLKDPKIIKIRVQKLLMDLKALQMDNNKLNILFYLGRILESKNENALAVVAYRSARDYVDSNDLVYYKRLIFGALARSYHKLGAFAKASEYYLLYNDADRVFTERRNAGLMARFRVKYETRQKEQDNNLLRSELKLKERTLQYYSVIGISVFLLLVIIALWLIMRQRTLRLSHETDLRQHEYDVMLIEEQERQLRKMIQDKSELNRKNEELRYEIERSGAKNDLQNLINSLSPRLLTREEELNFRRQFSMIHPTFITSLREKVPSITSTEELLAMLIKINLNNEEIAYALGNNKSSVITSRSRLRKKLGIDKSVILENYIRSI